MPKRWGKQTRAFAYLFLCARDGERCRECFAVPTKPISPAALYGSLSAAEGVSHTLSATLYKGRKPEIITLEIDHINDVKSDNRPENLQLLCKGCNVTKRNRRPSDLYVCVSERLRSDGQPNTRIAKSVVDYTQGSPEMQAANYYEPRFRNWLLGVLASTDFLAKDDIINSGAEIAGCSTATASRYLVKLTSSAGPLLEQRDLLGRTVIMLKPEIAKKDE
jgi:hypothetical protein